MSKFMLVFILLLSLIGCADTGLLKKDFPYVRGVIKLTIIYTSATGVANLCKPVNGVPAIACAKFDGFNNDCLIIAQAPKHQNDRYAFWVLGHELTHCTHGEFHD